MGDLVHPGAREEDGRVPGVRPPPHPGSTGPGTRSDRAEVQSGECLCILDRRHHGSYARNYMNIIVCIDGHSNRTWSTSSLWNVIPDRRHGSVRAWWGHRSDRNRGHRPRRTRGPVRVSSPTTGDRLLSSPVHPGSRRVPLTGTLRRESGSEWSKQNGSRTLTGPKPACDVWHGSRPVRGWGPGDGPRAPTGHRFVSGT